MIKKEIVIVGAGISGLYAGYILKEKGKSVAILEASDRAGGRIKSIEHGGSTIELGAEYIHGRHSVLYEMAEHLSLGIEPEKENIFYWFRGKLLSEVEAEQIPALNDLLSNLENIWQYNGKDISLQNWLKMLPFFAEIEPIAHSFAAEYGTDLQHLGMKALAESEKKWQSGKKNFRVKEGFQQLVLWLENELKDELVLQSEIKAIHYQGEGIFVMDAAGNEWQSEKVIVTVPVSSFKENKIQFLPPLPAEKAEAAQTLGFGAGMKVFWEFEERFWPNDLTEIWGGKRCPVYIAYPSEHSTALFSAYLMGAFAERISAKSEKEMSDYLLAEVAQFFGEELPAVKNLWVHDWGNEPFVKGAYSFETMHASGKREHLFEPIDNKLFFAGEAVHFEGHPATVHGAMETAEWVAEWILGNDATQTVNKLPNGS